MSTASSPAFDITTISTIIGLGNPGPRFTQTRHNAGFLLLDELADRYGGSWQQGPSCEHTSIQVTVNDMVHKLRLVKPLTFMNNSGEVMPWLSKQGVKADNLLVVHDELEKKFGRVMLRLGGSARGHNGLRSIIQRVGADYWRMRIGIDRPQDRKEVANYVLQPFTPSEQNQLPYVWDEAIKVLLGG